MSSFDQEIEEAENLLRAEYYQSLTINTINQNLEFKELANLLETVKQDYANISRLSKQFDKVNAILNFN